jgi:hypothetical protein
MPKHQILLLLAFLLGSCQSKPDQPAGSASAAAKRLLAAAPVVNEKLYERPSVEAISTHYVPAGQWVEIMDSADFFFYKVRLHADKNTSEGYILKAAFRQKPRLIYADSLGRR